MQSDPRTKNYGVTNMHTIIHHCLDPSLANTLQHCFMPGHNNVLLEVKWSILQWDFVPGFEDILQQGVDNGWYDINDVLEKWVTMLPVFHYCFLGSSSTGLRFHGYRLRLTNGSISRTRQPLMLSDTRSYLMVFPPWYACLHLFLMLWISRWACYFYVNHQLACASDSSQPWASQWNGSTVCASWPCSFWIGAASLSWACQPTLCSDWSTWSNVDTFWNIYLNLLRWLHEGHEGQLTNILTLHQETLNPDPDEMPHLPSMDAFHLGQLDNMDLIWVAWTNLLLQVLFNN